MKFRFLIVVSFFIVGLIVVAFLTSSAHAVTTHIVISEIQLSGTTATDEFIELYKRGKYTIKPASKQTAGFIVYFSIELLAEALSIPGMTS